MFHSAEFNVIRERSLIMGGGGMVTFVKKIGDKFSDPPSDFYDKSNDPP